MKAVGGSARAWLVVEQVLQAHSKPRGAPSSVSYSFKESRGGQEREVGFTPRLLFAAASLSEMQNQAIVVNGAHDAIPLPLERRELTPSLAHTRDTRQTLDAHAWDRWCV